MAQPGDKPLRGELDSAILSCRRAFVAVGLFSLAINLLLLAPAIYMLQVYDRVLSSRNEVTLLMLTLIVVGLYVLEAVIELVRSGVLIRTSAALDVSLAARVFDASFERYLRVRAGHAGQALADLANLRQFLTGQGLFAFFDAPWVPIYVGVIFLLSPWLGLFAIAAVTLLFAMAYLTERMTSPLLARAAREAQDAAGYAGSNLRNADAIEAMGMLGSLRERWFARQRRYLSLQAAASDRAAVVGAGAKFLRLTFQSGILGIGAWLVLQNQLTPGGMIAAAILMGRALAPVELAIGAWRGFVAVRGAYARLVELLAAHPARGASLALPRPLGDVAAENLVVVAPAGRAPILKGLSFRFPAGTMVAVIGPSAAGKSTLARALVGVWAPVSGAIRLDGADVHKWDKAQLGPWIGYLPQDVELFEGTVAENIARFGAIDSDSVLRAAKRAGVHDLVVRLPEKYDTLIGEGGSVLSAGQRQRVALARALYGDPALVVLDEANANLDDVGDAALIEALRTIKDERRTAFVITHRRNVLRNVDQIMVLAEGTIKAIGPREDILKALDGGA